MTVSEDIRVTPEIRQRVDDAFSTFIGNSAPVHAIKRSLIVGLASDPPAIDKSFLFSGPPSTGKSNAAERMTRCLGVPLVKLDGKALKSREALFKLLKNALGAHGVEPVYLGDQGGMSGHIWCASNTCASPRRVGR